MTSFNLLVVSIFFLDLRHLSIVLVIASAYLAIKMLFVMIPWVFVISLIALVVGIIW